MAQVAVQVERSNGIAEYSQVTSSVVARIKPFFYRCQFGVVISAVDQLSDESYDDATYVDLQTLKSNALYEIQDVEAAKSLLESMANQRDYKKPALYYYSLGRLYYYEADFEKAEEIFLKVTESAEDPLLRFRGFLGLGNVYYSQAKFHAMPFVIAKLEQLKKHVNQEDKISLLILLGNYYRSAGIDRVMARRYFEVALSQSYREGWNYFINRSLYGIATIEKAEGRTKELMCTLDLLKVMLKDSEATYFKFLVNDKFKDDAFSVTTPIEIDYENMRVRFAKDWFRFHYKPLLFNFIRFLSQRGGFVTKNEIAAELWPDQKYLPRTHDPRIFDIAKRIRSLIETYENNPVVLLSGRQGYKLACSTQTTNTSSHKDITC